MFLVCVFKCILYLPMFLVFKCLLVVFLVCVFSVFWFFICFLCWCFFVFWFCHCYLGETERTRRHFFFRLTVQRAIVSLRNFVYVVYVFVCFFASVHICVFNSCVKCMFFTHVLLYLCCVSECLKSLCIYELHACELFPCKFMCLKWLRSIFVCKTLFSIT